MTSRRPISIDKVSSMTDDRIRASLESIRKLDARVLQQQRMIARIVVKRIPSPEPIFFEFPLTPLGMALAELNKVEGSGIYYAGHKEGRSLYTVNSEELDRFINGIGNTHPKKAIYHAAPAEVPALKGSPVTEWFEGKNL